jgi:hypothetical protein
LPIEVPITGNPPAASESLPATQPSPLSQDVINQIDPSFMDQLLSWTNNVGTIQGFDFGTLSDFGGETLGDLSSSLGYGSLDDFFQALVDYANVHGSSFQFDPNRISTLPSGFTLPSVGDMSPVCDPGTNATSVSAPTTTQAPNSTAAPTGTNGTAPTTGFGVLLGYGGSAEAGVGVAGVSATGSAAGGLFYNSQTGFSAGGEASGGIVGYLLGWVWGAPNQTSQPVVAGAFAGAGPGITFTNAGNVQQLAGPFSTVTVNVGVGPVNGSIQVSWSNGIVTVTIGPPIPVVSPGAGASGSKIRFFADFNGQNHGRSGMRSSFPQ